MSAAIAIPQQDHRSSPHESAHHRHYQPIAPSRGSSYGQQQSPTSSPARAVSSMTQQSPWDRPRSDLSNSHNHLAPGRSQNESPIGRHSSDSRPPQVSMPEIKTERALSPGPEPPTAGLNPRKRPHKLDLDTSSSIPPARPSAPLTSKNSAGLSSMMDVATACLSPGFDTNDPTVRHQMDRSREMAEKQRAIIALRQQRAGGKGAESSGSKPAAATDFAPPTSTFSKPSGGPLRKKAPPSSLSLAAAASYGNEPRVIQSAPLHQTFTGLHRSAHPLSRQVLEHSHQHALGYGQHNPRQSEQQPYSPQVSTPHSTRLPPITDVFANEGLGSARPANTLSRTNSGPGSSSQQTNQLPAFAPINTTSDPSHPSAHSSSANPSPVRPPKFDALPPTEFPRSATNHESFLRSTAVSHPSQQPLQPPEREREREYRSAEEAMHSMVGGRAELLPKAVHYGGHQPPTPPSPLPPMNYGSNSDPRNYHAPARPLKVEPEERSDRRRTREEYERDHEDPGADEAERERERERRRVNGAGPANAGLGFGFGAWRDEASRNRTPRSPETMRRRKEEFVTICARAWDLLQGED